MFRYCKITFDVIPRCNDCDRDQLYPSRDMPIRCRHWMLLEETEAATVLYLVNHSILVNLLIKYRIPVTGTLHTRVF